MELECSDTRSSDFKLLIYSYIRVKTTSGFKSRRIILGFRITWIRFDVGSRDSDEQPTSVGVEDLIFESHEKEKKIVFT